MTIFFCCLRWYGLTGQNMVGPGEVDEDLEGETQGECERFGPVRQCLIYEMKVRCPSCWKLSRAAALWGLPVHSRRVMRVWPRGVEAAEVLRPDGVLHLAGVMTCASFVL